MVGEYSSVDDYYEVADDDYCYDCAKWIEADDNDCCPICETALDYSDRFATSDTAKVAISDAPKVNTYTGDIWNRSSGYTWGGGSWWNRGSTSGGTMGSMWGGFQSNDTNDAARMLKHKRHLDSLCKVVDPTVQHSLDWASGDTSYSVIDKGIIKINGKLLKDDEDNLDITAGIAIHEKLHLIHTKPLLKWEEKFRRDEALDGYEKQLLHSICNSVEDEYIEKQLAKDNAGFVTYINETKQYFFEKKLKDGLLEQHDNAFMDIMNTLLAFIRWPSQIDGERRKRHAKHLRFFARALKDGLDSRENTQRSIKAIFDYLREVAKRMAKEGDSTSEDIEKEMAKLKEDMGGADEMSKEEWDKVRDAVERSIKRKDERMSPVTKMLKGMLDELDKLQEAVDYSKVGDRDELSEELMKEMKELEESDYTEGELKDIALIPNGQKKITWRKAIAEEYERNRYARELKDVSKAVSSLKRKIDLYGNTEKYTIRNQKRGKIDKRMLHRIPAGRMDLFKNTIVQDDKPLDICLLVDESGSMGSYKMECARKSCIAMKEALIDNPKLNLWVFGHTADGEAGWHTDEGATNMTEYWGPNMKDRPMALGSMRARYENRDGSAILCSAMKVKKESEQPLSNKLMIIFSDGQPAAYNYGGYNGRKHVSKVVKHLEGQGWSIIQVGIEGAREWEQQEMFTNSILVNDINELAPKIGKIIRRVIKV